MRQPVAVLAWFHAIVNTMSDWHRGPGEMLSTGHGCPPCPWNEPLGCWPKLWLAELGQVPVQPGFLHVSSETTKRDSDTEAVSAKSGWVVDF